MIIIFLYKAAIQEKKWALQGLLIIKRGNELKTSNYFVFHTQILGTVDYLYCTSLPIFTIMQVRDGGCGYYHSSGVFFIL